MHRPLNPITEILIREIREVKSLVSDVKGKLENIDVEDALKEAEKKKS